MNTLPMIIKSRFLCLFYLKVKCSLHLFTVDHPTQKKKKLFLKMLTMKYDYNYSTTNVVFHFCKVLGLFVIRSKKTILFSRITGHIYKSLCRDQEQSFLKNVAGINYLSSGLCSVWHPVYRKLPI